MVFVLNTTNSIGNQFIAELRDAKIQDDKERFRRNLERLGGIFAYEISKTMTYIAKEVQTPLGLTNINVLEEQPVLAAILRAGLPLHQGVQNIFNESSSAFITAYRKPKKSGEFVIQIDHISTSDLNGKTLILCDTMLATGQSVVLVCKELMAQYKLKALHIVSVIASAEGVTHVKANLPKAHLWLGAIDEELTSKSYIVPGLGDAGDLAYGEKV